MTILCEKLVRKGQLVRTFLQVYGGADETHGQRVGPESGQFAEPQYGRTPAGGAYDMSARPQDQGEVPSNCKYPRVCLIPTYLPASKRFEIEIFFRRNIFTSVPDFAA